MKVLLLTTRLNIGGIGVYTTSLARSLKKHGIEVLVASSGGALLDTIKKDAIGHIDISVDTSAEIGPHILRAVKKLSAVIQKEGIDIIHAQTRVTQVIARLLTRKQRIGFVTTSHGFFKPRLIRRIFPCWGDRVIAISEAVRDHLADEMNVPAHKIRLIHNGIDIERFNKTYSPEERRSVRAEFGLTERKRVIGIIARLSEVKGHTHLLGAFAKVRAQLEDVELLIVGDGPTDYLKRLKQKALQLGIEEYVIFHPAYQDTARPLSVIDIFCMPSIAEGLGLSILEAMAMGLPVVASGVGGISTLIRDNENGLLVPPADEERLASAILKILADHALAQRMGLQSIKIVKDRFSLDTMTEKVMGVYREVLEQALRLRS